MKAKKESFHKEFAANERMEIEVGIVKIDSCIIIIMDYVSLIIIQCVPIQFASEKKDDPDPLKDMYFFSRVCTNSCSHM